MRYLIILSLLLTFSCGKKELTDSEKSDALSGAWRMTNIMWIYDSGDTVTESRLQYKMYVDGSVMWGFEAAPDSTEWFGYGNYYIEGDSLYESMISGSKAFRQTIQNEGSFFRMKLEIGEGSYTQIDEQMGRVVYETYERVQ